MNYFKNGLLIASGLIAYFMFMNILGLENNFYLRFVNFLIVIAGLGVLINSESKQKGATYISTMISGIKSSFIAVLSFLAFMSFYVAFINPSFILVMEDTGIWGHNLSLLQISFAIFFEGMASGLVISYAWLQYYKPAFSSIRS